MPIPPPRGWLGRYISRYIYQFSLRIHTKLTYFAWGLGTVPLILLPLQQNLVSMVNGNGPVGVLVARGQAFIP